MTDPRRARLTVLVSGRGSNLQAVLRACREGRLRAEVVAVVSNRRAALALQRAAEAGVRTAYAPLAPYKRCQAGEEAPRGRAAYDVDLARTVLQSRPDVVVLAGFMHVLSAGFLDPLAAAGVPVLNLHPALPGELPGTDAIARAWSEGQAGTRVRTGVMVHEVVPEVDAGPVWGTAEVPLLPGEPLEGLAERMHAAEHELLVSVLARLSERICGQGDDSDNVIPQPSRE